MNLPNVNYTDRKLQLEADYQVLHAKFLLAGLYVSMFEKHI